MKREKLSHNYYDTLADLRRDVVEYMDSFNDMRPHQKLGIMIPSDAEAQYEAEKN